jgi:hypothetical protein
LHVNLWNLRDRFHKNSSLLVCLSILSKCDSDCRFPLFAASVVSASASASASAQNLSICPFFPYPQRIWHVQRMSLLSWPSSNPLGWNHRPEFLFLFSKYFLHRRSQFFLCPICKSYGFDTIFSKVFASTFEKLTLDLGWSMHILFKLFLVNNFCSFASCPENGAFGMVKTFLVHRMSSRFSMN